MAARLTDGLFLFDAIALLAAIVLGARDLVARIRAGRLRRHISASSGADQCQAGGWSAW